MYKMSPTLEDCLENYLIKAKNNLLSKRESIALELMKADSDCSPDYAATLALQLIEACAKDD